MKYLLFLFLLSTISCVSFDGPMECSSSCRGIGHNMRSYDGSTKKWECQ